MNRGEPGMGFTARLALVYIIILAIDIAGGIVHTHGGDKSCFRRDFVLQ